MSTNILLEQSQRSKYSITKRILILLIDTIILTIGILGLFYTLGTKCIQEIAKDSINGINSIYEQECNKQNVKFSTRIYGIYQLDRDSYTEKIMNDENLSYDEAMLRYNDLYYEIDSNIQNYENYSIYYNNFNKVYYLTLIISFFLSSFIFLLLIPLLNKNHKTIGLMIFKSQLVYDNTQIKVTKWTLLFRALTIFAIEICLVYVSLQYVGLILIFVGSIISICITKNKKALHDILNRCHVELDKDSYTE